MSESSQRSEAEFRRFHAPASPAEARDQLVNTAVAQYEGRLIAYASRLLGGDVERARDIAQDTFLKLWTVRGSEVEQHLGAWLYRVCRNAALDARRKESRMSPTDVHALEGSRTRIHARSDGEPAEPAETARVLRELNGLTERQQEVLRLKFQGGLSYKDIGTVMDLTTNHVGVLIHNAIRTVRERLALPAVPVPGCPPTAAEALMPTARAAGAADESTLIPHPSPRRTAATGPRELLS